MSTGRYRLLWAFLADLTGLLLSFFYGMFIPDWIGSLLPHQVRMLRYAVEWLYAFLLTPLSILPPLHTAFLQNAGWTWLTLAILLRLSFFLRYLHRRSQSDDLARPFAGNPGDQYYEMVKRRYKEYKGSIQRWDPPFALRTPTWCYYTRWQSEQPDLFWRGRTLVIEKSLLAPDRLHELRPYLARELMYYNCEDVAFMDILASYPKSSILLNVTGLCILFPVALINSLLWPKYWQGRTLVADDFAYGLGQGYALYVLLDTQAKQDDALIQQRRGIVREIAQLGMQLDMFQKKAAIKDWNLSNTPRIYYGGPRNLKEKDVAAQFRLLWDQAILTMEELKKREMSLELQVQKAHKTRPFLDERIGQLRARVGTEQRWKARQGILPPIATKTLSTQQVLPQLRSGQEE